MHYFIQTKSELSALQLVKLAGLFETVEDAAGLAALLKKDAGQLEQLSHHPAYQEFHIAKPGGAKRFIQHPNAALKAVQTELNRYLQAVYYKVRPASVHGFVVSPNDETRPRNIYTNAQVHVKGAWFLNIDLQDFFHHVTEKMIRELFTSIFAFDPDLAGLLTGLTTYKGRLPMGAPTSPVLSNFVLYFVDRFMEQLARHNDARYSRYADDLTFSFHVPPGEAFIEEIRRNLESSGFRINEGKVRFQSRMEQPEITGLCIGKATKPTLSKSYLKMLKKEVAIYRWLLEETVQNRALVPVWFFDQFHKSLSGQVEFAGFVLGRSDRVYKKLAGKLRWG